MGKYTNLMSSALDVEKVNNALETAGSSEETVTELNRLVGATPLPSPYTTITQAIEGLAESGGNLSIKTFNYIGDGGDHMELEIPEDMHFCLSISGKGANNTDVSMMPFIPFVSVGFITHYRNANNATTGGQLTGVITFDNDNRKLSFYGASDTGGRCDEIGKEYTVYYI